MTDLLSAGGADFIKQQEGCRLAAYRDITGVWTIGYGHTGADVGPSSRITQAIAEKLFLQDIAQFAGGVENATLARPPSQGQFDAMVSLTYNVGLAGFRHSTVLVRHLAGNWPGAAAAFLWWDHAGGQVSSVLERRRQAEANTYLAASPKSTGKLACWQEPPPMPE